MPVSPPAGTAGRRVIAVTGVDIILHGFKLQLLHLGSDSDNSAVLPAQMLYLKVESMEDKVRYLHSIGVEGPQMGKVISRLPQLLSLDVANNMAPKFEYLCSELGGTAATIAGFPAYFSLSMPQR